MARVVSFTESILIQLSENEEFCRKQPAICKKIKKAPGYAYKCCSTTQETIAARKYWEGIKKQLLRLKQSDIEFIKRYLGADQLFLSYVDKNNKTVYCTW